MAQVEPMDIDSVGSDFDDKENSLLNSNVLPRTPCTEKGYEELDVSELNMKLRYSVTPASSPMSKSYTASYKDNTIYNINDDSLNSTIVNNANLTQSLNSSITKCEIVSKSVKLPLQALSTDQYQDNTIVNRSLHDDPNNITITINGNDQIDENLSMPSTSSSAVQTPEATTPTKDIPKDDGSPIIRGLKSVLNMFRSSQSPIPPEDDIDKKDTSEDKIEREEQNNPLTVLASTPKCTEKSKDNSSKQCSPLKDCLVFNDDLERELQWKDDTTILFKEEKIPIQKLFLQQSTSLALDKKVTLGNDIKDLHTTVEYMDISYNDSAIGDKTMIDVENKINGNNIETASGVESDGEFLDCETTYTKNEQIDLEHIIEKNYVAQEVLNENGTDLAVRERTVSVDKDTEILSWNTLSVVGKGESEEKVYISNTKYDIKSDKLVNEPIIPEIYNNLNKNIISDELPLNKEVNVTTAVLDASESELNNKKQIIQNQYNQSNDDLIAQNFDNIDQNKTNELEKINLLPNNFNCPMNEDNLVSKEDKQSIGDVTKSLNIVIDNIENISANEKNEINNLHNSDNKDQNKTICLENVNNLSNMLYCPINEESLDSKDDKQLTFDVTMPLNIVTGDNVNISTIEKIDTNNISIIEKEKVELNDNNGLSLNQGILQICETVTDETIHDHVNNILIMHMSDTFNLEKNKTVNSIEEDQTLKCYSEIPQKDKIVSDYDELNEIKLIVNHIQNNESPKVELPIKDNTNYIPFLLNQQDCINNLSDLNLNATEIHKKEQDIFANHHNINDLEHINSQNTAELSELRLNEIDSNLPIDIPLPSDDDIEKDSLMDNLMIKNIDVDDGNVKSLDCIIKDETMDSLGQVNVRSQEAVQSNSECVNILSNILPLSTNIDQVQIITELNAENITDHSLTDCDLSINKTEILDESSETLLIETSNKTEALKETATFDIADNTIILPCEQHQQSGNIIETVYDIDSASFAGHVECSYNHDNKQNNKGLKVEQNSNKKYEINKNETACNAGMDEIKFDEEIVTSANNSPYVSVSDLDLTRDEIKLNEIENQFETKSKVDVSPPISPKLSQKGYNIDFDEIDDPFATKTNIRMSPTPENRSNNLIESTNINQKQPDNQKSILQNRRKFQPERQKKDLSKKRFNSSYSFDRKGKNKEQKIIPIKENLEKKLIDETSKMDTDYTVISPVDYIPTDDVTPKDYLISKGGKDMDDYNITSKNIEDTVTVKIETKTFSNYSTEHNSSEENSKNYDLVKRFPSKNVFNLPEIDDINFNPFVSKSKIRNSPSPTFDKESVVLNENNYLSHPSNEITLPISNKTSNIEKDINNDKVESDLSNETYSSRNTDKDFMVREVATEDEDTAEGPFLEAEEFADIVKVPDLAGDTDMMQFEDLQTNVINENKDEGELFIDAEAFEFLLNQNKSNVVADSGKESLFLKFDPLFAKRVSSDGVLAALNRIQRRQSTPKKIPGTSNRNNVVVEEKATVCSTNVDTVFEESNDETNITVTKPMMVVNPAVNSLVSPKKSTTPPRINRRSFTFTSPAMAVIDRLLSLSGNSSTLDHDTSSPRPNREYNETDVALTQLRELLAEKEIHVHNLRSESKELKERLATMESQVRTLEKESEERLKKVNDLNDHLTEKCKINKSMAVVVEEYERTIASLISEMEQEKRRNAEERAKLISERDEQTAHLSSMEVSFSDLHSKYEKSKQIILSMKANENTYKKSMKEFEDNLLKMQNNYELLKQHATSKLNHANQELEKFNKAHESEVLKLNAMIKRKELHITSLEESLVQKTKANEELTAICDELINKVG